MFYYDVALSAPPKWAFQTLPGPSGRVDVAQYIHDKPLKIWWISWLSDDRLAIISRSEVILFRAKKLVSLSRADILGNATTTQFFARETYFPFLNTPATPCDSHLWGDDCFPPGNYFMQVGQAMRIRGRTYFGFGILVQAPIPGGGGMMMDISVQGSLGPGPSLALFTYGDMYVV